MWIQTLAAHKSLELALVFPQLDAEYRTSGLDPDLDQLLSIVTEDVDHRIMPLLDIDE